MTPEQFTDLVTFTVMRLLDGIPFNRVFRIQTHDAVYLVTREDAERAKFFLTIHYASMGDGTSAYWPGLKNIARQSYSGGNTASRNSPSSCTPIVLRNADQVPTNYNPANYYFQYGNDNCNTVKSDQTPLNPTQHDTYKFYTSHNKPNLNFNFLTDRTDNTRNNAPFNDKWTNDNSSKKFSFNLTDYKGCHSGRFPPIERSLVRRRFVPTSVNLRDGSPLKGKHISQYFPKTPLHAFSPVIPFDMGENLSAIKDEYIPAGWINEDIDDFIRF